MQFYKYEGFNIDDKWSKENDSMRVRNEKTRNISMKTTAFNQKLNDNTYIFVTEAFSDVISIGVIVNEVPDILNLISDYGKLSIATKSKRHFSLVAQLTHQLKFFQNFCHQY